MTKSSAKALAHYRKKRDPTRTNEPFGAERIARHGETWTGSFVVHQHGARRMHFDLRIESNGALASFAVPRGPSLDPADKRLAVQTENHPLEYLDFEDVIPEGNYGAGPMIAWDTGAITYLEQCAERGLEVGKLDFLLAGHKLRGRFALVLTGRGDGRQRQWLLLKKPDAHVRTGSDVTEREPYSVLSGLRLEQVGERRAVANHLEGQAAEAGAPAGEVAAPELVPMLCATTGGRLTAADRLYELKLDGVRMVAHKRDGIVSLRYRSRKQATTHYPEVTRAVRALAPECVVLDGEIVAFDDSGRPSFQRLAPRIHTHAPREVARARLSRPVQYVVFDLLQLGERDLRSVPLVERKRLLHQLLPGRGVVWALDHVQRDGRALFDWCRERSLEGVVSKLAEGPYRPGPRRTRDWIKIKCGRQEDFVVVGWITGSGSRSELGALELATWNGERFCYRGRAGSGLSQASAVDLLTRLRSLECEESVAVGEAMPHAGLRRFVRPELVVQIGYQEWTDEGRLRHPVFRGLREDVVPSDCRDAPPAELMVEAAEAAGEPAADADVNADVNAPPRVRSGAHVGPPAGERVQISNRDKVFWPDQGFTKGDLLDYYAAISDTLLPYLAGRPVMLVRHPDGVTGKSFYQWNVPAGTPDWIQTLSLRDEERDGKRVATFLIDSADALLHVINLGCIPLHVLASRQAHLESCDFVTIDFDLGDQPLHLGVKLLLSLRELLDEIELVGFPKTSGQSGLHVLVPLGPGVPYAVAKSLVELIGRLLQMRHPTESTMQRRVAERGGRVYIDTGQTGKSRTIVAPYSVRAYPGARVSTPLFWEEVHLALDPSQLTMFTVPSRVVERADPMAELLAARPDVKRAVKALGRLLPRLGE